MTKQRKVILEELCKVRTHPTADQVYEMVRKRLPRISLATVYRNLDVLSEAGVIAKLEFGGLQRRYDGNAAEHCHVRCMQCGKVADVPVDPMNLPEIPGQVMNGFSITGLRFEFVGICAECGQKAKRGFNAHSLNN